MFGYVKPCREELRVREYELYRALYCGICHRMRKKTGFLSSLSLSYDAVFLALCRMLVRDRSLCFAARRCVAHPFKKRPCIEGNAEIDYAARAFAVLAYEKLRDDYRDGGFFRRLSLLFVLPAFRRAAKRARLPALSLAVKQSLDRLHRLEDEKTPSVDAPAAEFGALLSLVFTEGIEGEHQKTLGEIGFLLGKFIYAADAADDCREDLKRGSYNPYALTYPPEALTESLPESIPLALRLSLAPLAEAVEKLPFADADAASEIIKNTIYLGLPDRIARLGKKDARKKERHP